MPHQMCIDHMEAALELVPPGNDELRMHLTEALKEIKSGYGEEGEEDEMMPSEDKSTPYNRDNMMAMMMKRKAMKPER